MKEVCRLDDLIALLTGQLNGGLKGFLRFDCILINIHLFVFVIVLGATSLSSKGDAKGIPKRKNPPKWQILLLKYDKQDYLYVNMSAT